MAAEIHHLKTSDSIGKAAALLHSLVPRAQCFCVYDRSGNCIWSSDGVEDYEIDAFVAELPDEVVLALREQAEPLKRSLPSGRTVLALPVPGPGDEPLGLLVALFSKNAGKSASFNPNLIRNILAPAVDVIADGYRLANRISDAEQRFALLEKELELVYRIDERIHATNARHSALAQLVGQSGRYFGVNYSVLLIPSKRIRISATHSTWKEVNRKSVDRYLIEQLLPKLDGDAAPAVFNVPPLPGEEGLAANGFELLACPLHDSHGNVEGVLAQLGRINGTTFSKSDRRFLAHVVRKVEYVIEQSYDAMTGFMNRKSFEAQLRESWKALRSDEENHQVIYFDLDNLQLVNDNFGHKAGDDVILRFARILEEGLPKNGVLSRLTGDDFCLLLTNVDTDAALDYAARVRDRCSELRYLEGMRSLQVTISTGIARFTRASGDHGAVLTAARMACETAKAHGRDRVEVYDDQNQSVIRRYDDMQLVSSIQQALDDGGFELLAQPIGPLRSKTTNPRFEILLRMTDTDGEKVPTKALFSAAERYRMMPQIDRWVVSHTLAKLSEARDFVEGQAAIFSINLSGQSLGDDDIFDFIQQEIRHSKVPATSLCFEITESAAVSNLAKAASFIANLRELGCSISLDDFGAGLSSFAYLKNFEVDTLKIDGGFIRDITENRISKSMVAAIVQVAEVMGLETVAEYVESDKTSKMLAGMGVHYAQGHAIGRPVAIDAVLDELSDLLRSSTV